MAKTLWSFGHSECKRVRVHVVLVLLQASRAPLPAEQTNAIWEEMKDMGVLVGKGGVYGTVSSTQVFLSFWTKSQCSSLLRTSRVYQ